MVVSSVSVLLLKFHTDTGTEHRRDPRHSLPDRDTRKHRGTGIQPTATVVTDTIFRALSVAVRKRRRSLMRGPKRFDIDQLVDDVRQAYGFAKNSPSGAIGEDELRHGRRAAKTKPKAGGSNYPKHDPKQRAF